MAQNSQNKGQHTVYGISLWTIFYACASYSCGENSLSFREESLLRPAVTCGYLVLSVWNWSTLTAKPCSKFLFHSLPNRSSAYVSPWHAWHVGQCAPRFIYCTTNTSSSSEAASRSFYVGCVYLCCSLLPVHCLRMLMISRNTPTSSSVTSSPS